MMHKIVLSQASVNRGNIAAKADDAAFPEEGKEDNKARSAATVLKTDVPPVH